MPDGKITKLMFILIAAFLIAGCGGNGDDDTAADGEPVAVANEDGAADDWAPVSESAGTPVAEYADPDAYTHPDGHFRVRWPANCGQFRTRMLGDAKSEEGLEMVTSFAPMKGAPDSGISVSVWFRESDGSASTPEKITLHIASLINERNLVITHQKPIMRLGMEGVAVYCKHETTDMLYWTETYLSKGRTLMISAWDTGDFMFEDPEIQRFFRSVEFTD